MYAYKTYLSRCGLKSRLSTIQMFNSNFNGMPTNMNLQDHERNIILSGEDN